MYRKITHFLETWKESKHRKPLILQGARQVGKTYGNIIPVEVKSADNTRAKSLRVYMDTYKPFYAIKLSSKNFAFEDNKKNIPLYATFCI